MPKQAFEKHRKEPTPAGDDDGAPDPVGPVSVPRVAVRTYRAPADATRRARLEQGCAQAGACWAAGCRADLRRQGRAAAGGWPGTMSEARARVSAYFVSALRGRSKLALTAEEHEWAARLAYAAARRDWLAHGEPDEPAG